ncbi:Gfo/Idh/MocA family protein [Sphingomonas flavalba]|uniref:Gfo/Idh/MocA family protein n=1 Tax=Sphingomonas flavalba TaxID=2559804 RepID=UPI00109DA355|nr:Gfo/Idh/MocA family oxidoreductase [Sphingomonas flavalba]
MTGPIPIAIVGVGKIARDQHLPAIAGNPAFALAATVGHHDGVAGVPHYPDIDTLCDAHPEVAAVALCTPPQQRHALARAALARGLHVLLEKPPGATVAEVADLIACAQRAGRTLFAAWHSRFAPAVEPARAWLAQRRVRSVAVVWKEDVRHWHPGQQWIWEAGGLGVFDPGINALSIATRILPAPFFLTGGTLSFPANREAPIAADLRFADADATPITAVFDWRQVGPQSWDITVETDDGRLEISRGGGALRIAGIDQPCPAEAEYPGLYARFAALIAANGACDVDVTPLVHVADAFLATRRVAVEAFA